MKEWIKDLKDDEIRKIREKTPLLLHDMPENKDKATLEKICTMRQENDSKIIPLFFSKRVVAYTAVAVFIVFLALFIPFVLIKKPYTLTLSDTVTTGDVLYVQNKESSPLRSQIHEGGSIITGKNSEALLKIDETIQLIIYERSQLTLSQLRKDNKKVCIDKQGTLLVNLENPEINSKFLVETPDSIVSHIGTKFIVSYINNQTKIAVINGVVFVYRKDTIVNEKRIVLKAGERLDIQSGRPAEKKAVTGDVDKIIKEFTAILELNIHQEKNEPKQNKESKQRKETEKKKWEKETIYTFTNPVDSNKSEILGFEIVRSSIICITHNTLFCIDHTGRELWKNRYYEKNHYFKSLPAIYDSYLYISTNDAIVKINLNTGSAIEIKTHSMIDQGYKMVIHNNVLYIPFSDGIYTLDILSDTLSEKPLFSISLPTTPLIRDEKLHVTSYLLNEISVFSLQGQRLNHFKTINVSECPPLFVDETLFVGDMSGMIYSFTNELELVMQNKFPSGITSLTYAGMHFLSAFLSNGDLVFIDYNTLKEKKRIKIDTDSFSMINYYKKPVVIGKRLFIGSNTGGVMVINTDTFEKEHAIRVSQAPISCSVSMLGDELIIGTVDGEIIIIKEK